MGGCRPQGVREVDGIPILDCLTAAIKTAEMQVDLKGLGVRRGATGLFEAPSAQAKAAMRSLFR